MKTPKLAAPSSNCRARSGHFKKPMPHTFTSSIRKVGEPTKVMHCSWCWKEKP